MRETFLVDEEDAASEDFSDFNKGAFVNKAWNESCCYEKLLQRQLLICLVLSFKSKALPLCLNFYCVWCKLCHIVVGFVLKF